jgi:DNA-binding NarL/FixJ family response regulator
MGKILGRLQAENTRIPGSPEELDQAASSEAPGPTRSPDRKILGFYETLTPREKDVLTLIGQGATNYEIAVELGLSEGTVKNYVSGILDSMGFRDRIQAALFAARQGLS